MTSPDERQAYRGNPIGPITVLFIEVAEPLRKETLRGAQAHNAFREAITREILTRGGIVKRSGVRTLIACWDGAEAIHSVTACRIALACQQMAHAPRRPSRTKQRLKVRVGIESRRDATGKLDPAEVVRNLIGSNEHYGCEIIIGAEAYHLARGLIQARELDWLSPPGSRAGRPIYELLGMRDADDARPSWPLLYEAGLAAYRTRNFSGALNLFLTLLTVRHRDPPARVMIQKCCRLMKSPPGEDWNAATSIATADTPR